jgi:hypothetical protein
MQLMIPKYTMAHCEIVHAERALVYLGIMPARISPDTFEWNESQPLPDPVEGGRILVWLQSAPRRAPHVATYQPLEDDEGTPVWTNVDYDGEGEGEGDGITDADAIIAWGWLVRPLRRRQQQPVVPFVPLTPWGDLIVHVGSDQKSAQRVDGPMRIFALHRWRTASQPWLDRDVWVFKAEGRLISADHVDWSMFHVATNLAKVQLGERTSRIQPSR